MGQQQQDEGRIGNAPGPSTGPAPVGDGSAPPLPPLVVGRDDELAELKRRVGVAVQTAVDQASLVRLRRERGLTQQQLAAQSKVSKRTIEDIESGRRKLHYRRTVDAIAAALGVRPGELRRPTPMQVLTAVRGWPGVGKTTLAAALAHDAEVIAEFPDGVLWASLGPTPDVFAELAAWGRVLGAGHVGQAAGVKEASGALAGVLRERRALLIVDDVWGAAHAAPFRVGGRGCATLVTTRLRSVADELAPTPGDVYRLDALDDGRALELLRTLAPEVVDRHPEESLALVRDLEGLPLALQVAGHLLRAESSRGWGVRDLLRELREDATRLLQAEVPADMADLARQTTPTVAALLKKSTDRLDPQTRERYAYLGAFVPKPATFGLADLTEVWEVPQAEAKRTAGELIDRGLLEPIGGVGETRFWMHALLVKHADSLCPE